MDFVKLLPFVLLSIFLVLLRPLKETKSVSFRENTGGVFAGGSAHKTTSMNVSRMWLFFTRRMQRITGTR